MRYISAREYAEKKNVSLGHVYELMREKKLPWVEKNKVVKRIPWDDDKEEVCQDELVAS